MSSDRVLVAEGLKLNFIHECLLKSVWQSSCKCVYCFILVRWIKEAEAGVAELYDRAWSGHPCTAVTCDSICWLEGLICGNFHIINELYINLSSYWTAWLSKVCGCWDP